MHYDTIATVCPENSGGGVSEEFLPVLAGLRGGENSRELTRVVRLEESWLGCCKEGTNFRALPWRVGAPGGRADGWRGLHGRPKRMASTGSGRSVVAGVAGGSHLSWAGDESY